MIMTLSPAKIMSFSAQDENIKLTEPIFKSERNEIISILEKLSLEEMQQLMHINRKQAEVVYPQIHQFKMPTTPEAAAASTYNGIAFKGLNFAELSTEDKLYAQEHLLIGSAVYGFLRPLDKIKAYRLEMMAKLSNPRGETLYDYWKDLLTKHLAKRLKQEGNIWLNLCSDEYASAIDRKGLPKTTRVITPLFKEETPKGYRQVVVHTKKARGTMARFVIQNKITEVENLQAFDLDNYSYAEHLSSSDEPVFIR